MAAASIPKSLSRVELRRAPVIVLSVNFGETREVDSKLCSKGMRHVKISGEKIDSNVCLLNAICFRGCTLHEERSREKGERVTSENVDFLRSLRRILIFEFKRLTFRGKSVFV